MTTRVNCQPGCGGSDKLVCGKDDSKSFLFHMTAALDSIKQGRLGAEAVFRILEGLWPSASLALRALYSTISDT